MTDFTTTLGDGVVRMELEESLYPRDALYGAAYVFIDRCYVHLDRGAPGRIHVDLRLKAAGAAPAAEARAALEAMAAELHNEILGQAWRHQIVEENRSLLESIAPRALGTGTGAAAGGSLDDLLAGIDGDAAFEDPLGIAVSWEQKYAKKTDAATGPAGGEGGAS